MKQNWFNSYGNHFQIKEKRHIYITYITYISVNLTVNTIFSMKPVIAMLPRPSLLDRGISFRVIIQIETSSLHRNA